MPPLLLQRLLAALLVLGGAALLVDLDGSSIWDANEAFYVETPREMVERGDYVNPTFNYEPRINKPALSYWMVAGLYHVFGVSVAVERAAIAAAALVVIAAAFGLGRAASPALAAPLLAALGLAANPRFFMFGRRILVDMLLAALMTLTLLLFAWAERHPQRRRLLLILMYVSVGLGMLAKGPVAAVLPALAFVVYLAYHRELGRIRSMMLPAGAAIVLVIVAPWYVLLYQANGWGPIATFFIGENLERYTTMIGASDRGPLFYLPVLLSDGLPWSLLLPAAVAAWLRGRREVDVDSTQRVRTLLLIWIAVIVGFYSLSSTKQDLYILPAMAAVAALGADVLARGLGAGVGRSGLLRASLLASGLVFAGAGAFVLYVFTQAGTQYAIDGATTLAAIVVAGGLGAAGFAVVRRLDWAALVLVAALVGANWTLVLRALPSFERYKPAVPLSDAIRARLQPGDVVAHFDVTMPSMVFYLQRRIEMASMREHYLNIVRAARGTLYTVMPEHRFEEVRAELGPSSCILARHPTFDARLREILERQPPRAIVLVSTRCDQAR